MIVDLRSDRTGPGGSDVVQVDQDTLPLPRGARLYLEPWRTGTQSCVWDVGALDRRAPAVRDRSTRELLPPEGIARIDGRAHRCEVRAYLPATAARELAEPTGIPITELARVIARLVRVGPELLADEMPDQFPAIDAVVAFRQGVCAALGLEERYVPVGPGTDGSAGSRDLTRTWRANPRTGGRTRL